MTTQLACACGRVGLEVTGEPIIAAECHCTSCRAGAVQLGALPGAPVATAANGGTPYILYRKDRVTFTSGMELLRAFRLSPTAPTRRVVASCCNTPIFVEFQHGHWLSLYATLWPAPARMAPELRTQTADAPAGTDLSSDIPSGRLPTLRFYGRLLAAWIGMGFKTPTIAVREVE